MFPYDHINAHQFWTVGCHQKGWGENPTPILNQETSLVSAGSCFARRLARYLQTHGFNYLNTEPGPPWLSAEERTHYHYGTYSARYGNVYSSLQLWQLLERAWGVFKPLENAWKGFDGVVDPFRPTVHFNGFSSEQEMCLDRSQHLEAVKQAFMQADVFIFTLGLTDVWVSQSDGALFPLCPGKQVGQFSPEKYSLKSIGLAENMLYLKQSIAFLKSVNPQLKVILSVSPVPLAASLSAEHILQASIYTKSLLRVCAEDVSRQYEGVYYFPSYDFIQHGFHGREIFDLASRQLLPHAEKAVMDLFLQRFFDGDRSKLKCTASIAESEYDNEDLCDEGLLLQQIYKDFDV